MHSAVTSSIGGGGAMPALLTMLSNRPSSETAFAMRAMFISPTQFGSRPALVEPATPLDVVGLRRGDAQGEIDVAVGSLGVRADFMRGVRDLLGESLLEARHADIEPGL